mgnify:CR=1 FL=1
MVVPPNQPYYPPQGATPIHPGVSLNNYPLQPTALNVQQIHQNQYYKPYSLVQHKGIFQTENNTFYIKSGYFMKIFPFLPLFIGLCIMLPTLFFLPTTFIPFIFGLIYIVCSLVCFCKWYHSFFIILGPTTLTVIRKAICNKKCTIYNQGELEKIDFTITE